MHSRQPAAGGALNESSSSPMHAHVRGLAPLCCTRSTLAPARRSAATARGLPLLAAWESASLEKASEPVLDQLAESHQLRISSATGARDHQCRHAGLRADGAVSRARTQQDAADLHVSIHRRLPQRRGAGVGVCSTT